MRRLSPEEHSIIEDSLNAIDRGLFKKFLSGKALGAIDGATTAIVLVDEAVLALGPDLTDGASGGLPVGTMDEDGFALDLQGAAILARETRRQTITVTEKSARLFIYGRDVLAESILNFDPRLNENDHCIVLNPRHEALGIGLVVGRFKGRGRAVAALHDLGSYLRDQ